MGKFTWEKRGFDEFMKGSLGNGGQNIYVSRAGVLQRIHQYDITGNGYPDLIYSNSQSMGERPPLTVYSGSLDREPKQLRSHGSFDATLADISGDGTLDLIVASQHDGVKSDITAIIYYASPEGYTEKYMTELYVPSAVSVTAGDFRGIGKNDVVFARVDSLRIFEQTSLGIEPTEFRDADIEATSVVADDLDGDGYCDLYVLAKDGAARIYWGSESGISADNFTELPYAKAPANTICTSTAGRIGITLLPWCPAIVDFKGEKCVFAVDGGNVMLDSLKGRSINNILKLCIPGAVHAATGYLTSGNDLFIATYAGYNDECESYLLLERDGYSLDTAKKITTRGAHTATIASLVDGEKPYLFIANTSTRRSNDMPSLALRFDDDGNVTERRELPGHCTMRILVGNSGIDGENEMVMVNHESGLWSGEENIYVYLNDENGFSPDKRLEFPGLSSVEGQMIDFDDKGHPDVIVVCCAENQPNLCTGLYIYHNEGDGPDVNLREDVPCALPHGIAVGDFRHSGYLDIAVGGIHSREMYILEGGPDGYSEERMKKIVFGPEGFVPFDWRGENEDILDTPVYSPEEFKNIGKYGQFRWMFTADLNGDGYLDLIIPLIIGPRCYVMWGGPDGFSKDNMQILATDGAGCANVADLNGDGYPDLILGGHISLPKKTRRESYVTIYWNGPEGLKENRKTSLPAWCANSIAVGDFNGDGVLDIFATSYSNNLVRDLDSFIYFGDKEKGFTYDNTQRIFNNSGCGCLAGDFNHDGYVDLAVGSHKKEGNHVCESFVYWGGPDGIREDRRTALPTRGVHGMTTVDIGNIMDRSDDEFYYSETYAVPAGSTPAYAEWDATNGVRTRVTMQIRSADTEEALASAEWSRRYECGERFDSAPSGTLMQYRLVLTAESGCGTPRVTSVRVNFE